MDVLDTKNADEDGVVNDNGAALEEEYVYFSGMVGESTNWAKEGVKSCGLDKQGIESNFCFVIYA